MTVRAIKSWITDPDTGSRVPVFTKDEARLLIEMLDQQRAAGLLSDEDWKTFRDGKDKLLFALRTTTSNHRLFVNAERTVLVRIWDSGAIEVALRDSADHVWGPPIRMVQEDVT